MSRLGTWRPDTVEGRLDRLEALAEIRQLPYRYALALDSRDLDALVALFVPNVQVGRDAHGREALRAWFSKELSGPKTSVHFIGGHIIDFAGPDEAHGIVYCHDELEQPERGEWQVGMLQYWDTYRRVEGDWCFHRRKFHRWYLVDALTRPGHGLGVGSDGLTTGQLPEAFRSWAAFWAAHDQRTQA
jgi:hypothetical protein